MQEGALGGHVVGRHADPPTLDRGDAAAGLEARLDPTPRRRGIVRVVMHSIAFQYFPPATKERIIAHMGQVGGMATTQAPVAWLSYKIDPAHRTQADLRLRVWPSGQEQILATGDPHAVRLSWRMAEDVRTSEAGS